jgi:hypothetical protein
MMVKTRWRMPLAKNSGVEKLPKASNRAIARALGVDESTVRADTVRDNPAGAGKRTNKTKGGEVVTAGNPAPGLSGIDAAKAVAKTEAKERRQASAPISLAGPQQLPDEPKARQTITGLQDHPEQFPDGASMSMGTKRLIAIAVTLPCGRSIQTELGDQKTRRCTVAQPNAIPIRRRDQISVALVSRQHRSGRRMPATDRKCACECCWSMRLHGGSRNLPPGTIDRSTRVAARSMSFIDNVSWQEVQKALVATMSRPPTGTDSRNAPTRASSRRNDALHPMHTGFLTSRLVRQCRTALCSVA